MWICQSCHHCNEDNRLVCEVCEFLSVYARRDLPAELIGMECTGFIGSEVKGGHLVNVGKAARAFLPQSLAGLSLGATFAFGQEITASIIKVQIRPRGIVLSRLPVLKAASALEPSAVLAALSPGDIVRARVERLTNYGVFVRVNGVPGLIHNTELSWDGKKGNKFVSVGETLETQVVSIDRTKRRVNLSRRRLLLPPWEHARQTWPAGSTVVGQVTDVRPYGAFVELPMPAELGNVSGLVHITELNHAYFDEPSKVVSVGEHVPVKILSYTQNSVKLSTKRAIASPEST